MKFATLVLGAALLAPALMAPNARATQVLLRSPQQLGSESALVVRGTVGDVRSYWNTSRSKIFTEARVDVDESYKGAPGDAVRVVQLGGVVGHVRMTVHGAVAFRQGEEVLLFLDPFDAGSYQISGFSQGFYRIIRDQRGERFVVGAPDGAAIPKSPGSGTGVAAAGDAVHQESFVNHALGRE